MNNRDLKKLSKSQLIKLLLKQEKRLSVINNNNTKPTRPNRPPPPIPEGVKPFRPTQTVELRRKQKVVDDRPGWVRNPNTNRWIKIDGPTYRHVLNKIDKMHQEINETSKLIDEKYKKVSYELEQKNKQSINVLLFRRLDDGEKPPKGMKVAFKDHKNKRYIIRVRRYYIVSGKDNFSKYIDQRLYDCIDNKDNYEKYTKVMKAILDSDEDIDGSFSTYVNCIIIKSVSKFDQAVKDVNLLDEDLFMSRDEYGVFNRYLNFDLKKTFLPNEKANSCFVNIIVNRFKDQFNNKKYKFKVNHETLCELCDIEYKNENIGLSINKSLVFFKKFQLGLCVYGPYGCIFKYKPDKRNKNVNKSSLFIFILNNHCYEINQNIKKFEQLFWKTDDENINSELQINNVSDNYNIRINTIQEVKPIFIKSIDDVIKIIKDTKEERLTFIYNDYLESILFETINKLNYTPGIKLLNGKIISLQLKYNNVLVTITTSDMKQDDTDVWIDEDDYEEYHNIDDTFYNGLICKEHMSFYNDITKKIENTLLIGPKSGYFNRFIKNPLLGVDSRKAYTSDFMDIEHYPVFNHFDIWQEYDNSDIEDYNQYIVKVDRNANPILFSSTISRCYGYKLNRINENYEVLYMKKPSNLILSNSKDLVKKVFDSKLDISLKKFIVNKNLGLIEKKRNKKSISRLFKNYNEALYYQTKLGKGDIIPINEEEIISEEKYNEIEGEILTSYKTIIKDTIHLLHVSEEKELINGFLPIKELIYEIRSLKNYNTFQKLKQHKIEVHGIKTDSLLVNDNPKNRKLLRQIFDLSDEIGCFKLEFDKYLTDKKIEITPNELPHIEKIKVNEYEVKDEYDTNELINLMRDKNIFVKGSLPGVGKTTACKNNKDVLFISPSYKLCQQLRKDGYDSITLNKLLAIGIDDDKCIKMKKYDISQYKTIVFDEVLLYNPKQLYLIKMFMDNNKDKRFHCTRDIDQRKPFTFDCNNVKDENEYQLSCINQMFPDQITLKINKRLKRLSDKKTLMSLKREIFDLSKNPIEVLKNHGIKIINKLKDVKTTKNICLFNFRCNQINNYVSKNIIKKQGFYKGLEIVCKSHYKTTNMRLYVNYHYVIESINEKNFTILESVDDIRMTLTIDKLDKHFKLPYASTCDSVQGLSIGEKMTLFDCNTPYVDSFFIWTALTRAKYLKNVQVFEHSRHEVMSLRKSWVKLYLRNKVNGYKQQDKRAGREYVNKDYIDVEWFKTQYRDNKSCPLCRAPFEVVIENDNNVTSNITADRKDNRQAHIVSNCQLMCVKCNNSKR